MKNKLIIIFSIILLAITSYGCARENEDDNGDGGNVITENVKLFYADEDNETMVVENVEVTFAKADDKYKIVLEELIKGPKDNNLTSNIPEQTEVNEVNRQGQDLTVDLSEAFNNFEGDTQEMIAVASVVNTMTQFNEVQRVKILVEGEELVDADGNSRGFMVEFPTDLNNMNGEGETTEEVTLYFGNRNADAVVAEKTSMTVNDDMSRSDVLKQVIEKLIQGPTSKDLHATIPSEVKVLSVKVENNIAYVDFSEEMHTKHWGGAAGESMTINSIVNTLTEFEDIDKVKITVKGEPLAIEHMILEEPLERNEDMIGE